MAGIEKASAGFQACELNKETPLFRGVGPTILSLGGAMFESILLAKGLHCQRLFGNLWS